MPFKKNDPNINRSGRPRGAKNKNNPARQIQEAIANGSKLEDIEIMIQNMLERDSISEKTSVDLLKLLFEVWKYKAGESEKEDSPKQEKEQKKEDKPKGNSQIVSFKKKA